MSRIRTLVAAGALAATAWSGALVAPSAALAAGAPVINWATTDEENLGVLRVSITAEADVTSITAHIISEITSVEVAVSNAFVRVEGTDRNGVWVSAPFSL